MTTNTPRFWGEISICLWFRENPSSRQESGPPIPGYYIEFTGNSEVLGNGYTDEDGCISVPFASSWPGDSLSIEYKMHDGGGGTDIYASDSNQTIDMGDLSMDWLPDHFQQTLDCSACNVYYPDKDFDSIETSSLGRASPLMDLSCSTTHNWGLNCCGYDWGTSRCGVQQFFPEFSFLHECGGCKQNEIKDLPEEFPEYYLPGYYRDDPPPVDCSTCDMYYPSGDDSGEISPLTNHACTSEDENDDGRWGEHCCAYDWENRQCWVEEFETQYTYLNENSSSFIYPCGGKCAKKGKTAAYIGCGVAAFVIAILFSYFRYRRKIKNRQPHDNTDNPVLPEIGHQPNSAATQMGQIASGLKIVASPVSNEDPLYPQSPNVVNNYNENIAVAFATPVLNADDHIVQIDNDPWVSDESEHAVHPQPSAPPMTFEHKGGA